MRRQDEVEFLGFARAVADAGVHLVCAAGPQGVAAGALVGKALARAGVKTAGLTVLSYGESVDSPVWRAWLADAPALLLIGCGVSRPLGADAPQYSIDGCAGEALAERAFRLGETLVPLGDVSWCAAVGLCEREPSHVLVERALGRHTSADFSAIAELLDAAARGPEPAANTLLALEMLVAAPDPRRFLKSVAAAVLRRTQTLVRGELARATRVRPRAGFGVVVIEYLSACHLEDLVAARWRGLRPGTAVLVANHGAVDSMVSVTARAAIPEALERLRATLGDEGTTLLDPETWSQLCQRLGVPPAVIEHIGNDAVLPSALPN